MLTVLMYSIFGLLKCLSPVFSYIKGTGSRFKNKTFGSTINLALVVLAWSTNFFCDFSTPPSYFRLYNSTLKYTLISLRYMWVGLLTDRIDNKLERSNLINEHALNRVPVPLRFEHVCSLKNFCEEIKVVLRFNTVLSPYLFKKEWLRDLALNACDVNPVSCSQ